MTRPVSPLLPDRSVTYVPGLYPRRAAELDSGRVRGIPAEAVFAELDRRLRR